ncbi:hypothetical protein ACHM17_11250 [Clostridium perfringens]|uniref:Uncharacterized protein n=1 Tax=Clostridium perfringens TaxID=1502 RepID=A0A8H9QWE8_CLOPF|nr:hypothetical protein [Clostridium perfringens]HAT4307408.1 hypothetical protein [Clostridium perfringens]
MYRLVSLLSMILRTFMFSNPFTRYFELALANSIFSTTSTVFAEYFNFTVGGGVLCLICYPLVGIVYDRGEAPAIGSILYLVAVLVNSQILVWISNSMIEFNIKELFLKFFFLIFLQVIVLKIIRYFKDCFQLKYLY